MHHIIVGPRRKPRQTSLGKYERKAKERFVFKVNESLIGEIKNQQEKEILSEIFLKKVPVSEAIRLFSERYRVPHEEARAVYDRAYQSARMKAKEMPQNIVKRTIVRKSEAVNWENPTGGQLRRFRADVIKTFDRKLPQIERNHRMLREYAKGENVSRIARNEGLAVGTAHVLITQALKTNPSVRDQRKQAKAGLKGVVQEIRAANPGPKQERVLSPQFSEKKRGVEQRKLLRLLKNRGVSMAYAQGATTPTIAEQFNMTKANVSQKIVAMRKEQPDLIEQRKSAKAKQRPLKKERFLRENKGNEAKRGVVQRKLIRTLKNIGVAKGYAQGEKLGDIAQSFNMTKANVNQKLVAMRKEMPGLTEQRTNSKTARKALPRQRAITGARVALDSQKAQRNAQKEERNRLILEQYLSGARIKSLGNGFGIAPNLNWASAYGIVKRAIKENPSLLGVRQKALETIKLTRSKKVPQPKTPSGTQRRRTNFPVRSDESILREIERDALFARLGIQGNKNAPEWRRELIKKIHEKMLRKERENIDNPW
ncbi:MAG: hypothetical protein AABW59_03635 [archaeon]